MPNTWVIQKTRAAKARASFWRDQPTARREKSEKKIRDVSTAIGSLRGSNGRTVTDSGLEPPPATFEYEYPGVTRLFRTHRPSAAVSAWHDFICNPKRVTPFSAKRVGGPGCRAKVVTGRSRRTTSRWLVKRPGQIPITLAMQYLCGFRKYFRCRQRYNTNQTWNSPKPKMESSVLDVYCLRTDTRFPLQFIICTTLCREILLIFPICYF